MSDEEGHVPDTASEMEVEDEFEGKAGLIRHRPRRQRLNGPAVVILVMLVVGGIIVCAILQKQPHAPSELPEQLHLSLGYSPHSLHALWVTASQHPQYILWSHSPIGPFSNATAHSLPFDLYSTTSTGNLKTHSGVMSNLDIGVKYYYKVGSEEGGYSGPHEVVNQRSRGGEGDPWRYIVVGDLGAVAGYSLCGGCSRRSLVCDKEVCTKEGVRPGGIVSEVDSADLMIHLGDHGYNLGFEGGEVGRNYFRNIEQVAARVPFMPLHGNHEGDVPHLPHYLHHFRHVPADRALPKITPDINNVNRTLYDIGTDPAKYPKAIEPIGNNLYYAYDHGLVHFVAISTELFFSLRMTLKDGGDEAARFLEWLELDLKKAQLNRKTVPWVVVHGHRPLYCSDGECPEPTAILRAAMEDMFFEYGVDLYLSGHQHNYERMWPTYRNKSAPGYVNPKAPIHIVTGAGGNRELREPFLADPNPMTAVRGNAFGYSRLLVHNRTHINWQQVSTEPKELIPEPEGFTSEGHGTYGSVIDDIWVVQDTHGPFDPAKAPSGTEPRPPATTHDHFAVPLGFSDGPGTPAHREMAAYVAANGRAAWDTRLAHLLETLSGGPASGDSFTWHPH